MKKILLNFVTLGREGVDIPRLLKFRALDSLGFELTLFSGTFLKKISLTQKDVYTFNGTLSELRALSEPRKTKIGYMFWALKRNIRAFFSWRNIKNGGYDVIYSPAAVLDLVLFPYFYKLFHPGMKWAVVFDNIVPFRDPGNRIVRFLAWLFFKASLFFLKKADRIFIVSEDLRKFLLKKGFDEDRIVLSGNGVDSNLIQKAVPDSRFETDALFMGRINETKGIYDMLKILEMVRKDRPGFRLSFMGEGDETTKRQFRKKINKMGLENNVRFLGFRTGLEKFNIMKSARCFWFLSVSKSESFGVALLEAVCLGLPAFTYDLAHFSKIYRNGEIEVSPTGDWETVAEKVIQLFEKGNFQSEAGRRLLDKYSWERVAEIEYHAIVNLSV